MIYKVTFDNNKVKYFDEGSQKLAERLAVYSEIIYDQDELRINLIDYLLGDIKKTDEDIQLLFALSSACDRANDEEDDDKLDVYYNIYSNQLFHLINNKKDFAATYLAFLTLNRYFDIESEEE